MKRRLLALAAKLGARVTYSGGRHDVCREIVIAAPAGFVWTSNGCHDCVANSSDGEPFAVLEAAILDDLNHGLTPCTTLDCETCT